MSLPLEDSWIDVINKAKRGLKADPEKLAHGARIEPARLEALFSGQLDEAALERIAPELGLEAPPLLALARGSYHPGDITLPAGAAMFTTDYHGEMTVNAFLVWDTSTGEAAAFDTGATADPILKELATRNLQLKAIFLTHTHGDHINDITRLQKETSAVARVCREGDIGGVELFSWGDSFTCGSLKIGTRQTTGHAADGTTFVIDGLESPLAIVGDAVFAGSMGGGMISYTEALETNRKNILSLTGDTILCPGHGPLTTVALEKKHNPFLATDA